MKLELNILAVIIPVKASKDLFKLHIHGMLNPFSAFKLTSITSNGLYLLGCNKNVHLLGTSFVT
jgi:hypothetical protein